MNGSHGELPHSLDVFHRVDVVLIDERASRPSFADDEAFEVEVERRFLLWYKCIRRTKPVTIDQVRTGDCEYRVSHSSVSFSI